MRKSDIETKCQGVSSTTGIPVAWVQWHVDQRAGKPCAKCSGTGLYGMWGRCFRCEGTGGKATPARVAEALKWVKDNVPHVLALGESREKGRQTRKENKAINKRDAIEMWKRDNPRHWWALENMPEGEFRDSLLAALDNILKGWMTEKRMMALWMKADELERQARGVVKDAPLKGATVEIRATITDYSWCHDRFANQIFRVKFQTVEGWRGRFDITDAILIRTIEGMQSNMALLRGTIEWSKGNFGIFGSDIRLTP